MTFCKYCEGISSDGKTLFDTANAENTWLDYSGSWLPHQPDLDDLLNSSRNGCVLCQLIEQAFRTQYSYLFVRREGKAKWPILVQLILVKLRFTVKDSDTAILGLKFVCSDHPKEDRNPVFLTLHHAPRQMSGTEGISRENRHVGSAEELAYNKVPYLGRLADTHPESATTLGLVREWLSQCISLHDGCSRESVPELPARVIDVGPTDGSQMPLLYETQNRKDRYLILSHCWGGKRPLVTDSTTLPQHLKGIQEASLPKTFRDAIFVTRQLGFRYLWIDSLCIIQDSGDDWSRECSRMHRYYREATLTISALTARNGGEGFLNPRSQLQYTLCRLAGSDEVYACHADDSEHQGRNWNRRVLPTVQNIQGMPVLQQRGWCLQERLLSSRILHYTHRRVYWECQSMQVTDDFPHADVERSCLPPRLDRIIARGAEDSTSLLYKSWGEIVREYSKRQLTEPSDKFPAISGMAADMQHAFHDTYLAGLWKNSLIQDLTWTVSQLISSKRIRTRAPSWSWASLDADIETGYHDMKDFTEHPNEDMTISHADVQLMTEDPFGQVKSAKLHVSGLLAKASVVKTALHIQSSYLQPISGSQEPASTIGSFQWDTTEDLEQQVPIALPDTARDTIRGTKHRSEGILLLIRLVETVVRVGTNNTCICLGLRPTDQNEDEYERVGLGWSDPILFHGCEKRDITLV